MDAWSYVLESNLPAIYAVYGASFLFLALAVYVQPKDTVAFPLANHLWLLGAFGLLHGLKEFFDLWQYSSGAVGPAVAWAGAVLLVVSYVPLVEFARRAAAVSPLASRGLAARFTNPWIYLPLGLGLLAFSLWAGEGGALALGAGGRYLLGFPGAVVAGLALMLALRAAGKDAGQRALRWGGAVVGGGLILYGLLAGLIVARVEGLPGWLPTNQGFLSATGVPVQLLRAVCALTIGLSLAYVVRSLVNETHRRERQATVQLQTLALGLEQRVAERTAELQKEVVDRRRVEAALRESEGRLNEAQRLAQLGSWDLDMTTNRLIWSAEIYRIFEVDPKEFRASYQAFLDLVHPDDRDAVNKAYADSVANRAPYEIVHRLVMQDGRIKHVAERGVTFYADDGTPLRSVGSVQDITARVRAEESLRRSQALLLRAERLADLGSWEWELTTDRMQWSPQMYRLLQLDLRNTPEPTGALFYSLIHPEDVPTIQANLEHSLDAGVLAAMEYRLSLPDGTLRFVRAEGEVTAHANGKPVRLTGFVQDITEQRQAQDALQRLIAEIREAEARERDLRSVAQHEQRRMAALLSAMSIGILFEDRAGCVDYVNPAFRRMWGIDDGVDLSGRGVVEVLEVSSHRLARPDHASKHVLRVLDTHEISERFEIDLYDGRILTQLSYPVTDAEGRVLGRLWIYEDITHERQTAQQLLYLAERDPLTGLYNRHRFELQLEERIQASRRSGAQFCLLYFDLDEFKYINDTYGHRAGDTVLVRTAGEVSALVRSGEVFARLGGDEFAVLTSLVDNDEIGALPTRVVRAVSGIPLRFRGTNLRLTASVGVAVFPDHGDNTEDLVAHADAAMYQAKSQGKNTWAVYDPDRDLSEVMTERLTWNRRIAQALETDGLELHFQGVYDPRTLRLSHLEALVRMRDVGDGDRLIMPGQFVPFAEKSGQVKDIDLWVMRRCVALLKAHPQLPAIAVNVSGRTIDEPTIPDVIRAALVQYGVDASRLIVELTETSAVSDLQDAQRFIEALHKMGCRVCLDDFGTGYSTFAYLKYLGVEILKIDGLFIRDLPNSPDNQAFVKAMVDVARGLGKTIVAEFVEDRDTLVMVRDLGVDLVQGYELDRPSLGHHAFGAPASPAA